MPTRGTTCLPCQEHIGQYVEILHSSRGDVGETQEGKCPDLVFLIRLLGICFDRVSSRNAKLILLAFSSNFQYCRKSDHILTIIKLEPLLLSNPPTSFRGRGLSLVDSQTLRKFSIPLHHLVRFFPVTIICAMAGPLLPWVRILTGQASAHESNLNKCETFAEWTSFLSDKSLGLSSDMGKPLKRSCHIP